jgi:hypothetical protein
VKSSSDWRTPGANGCSHPRCPLCGVNRASGSQQHSTWCVIYLASGSCPRHPMLFLRSFWPTHKFLTFRSFFRSDILQVVLSCLSKMFPDREYFALSDDIYAYVSLLTLQPELRRAHVSKPKIHLFSKYTLSRAFFSCLRDFLPNPLLCGLLGFACLCSH